MEANWNCKTWTWKSLWNVWLQCYFSTWNWQIPLLRNGTIVRYKLLPCLGYNIPVHWCFSLVFLLAKHNIKHWSVYYNGVPHRVTERKKDFQEKNLEWWVKECPVGHYWESGLQTRFRHTPCDWFTSSTGNRSITDSLGRVGLRYRGSPLHYKMCNSIPGIHPLEASYTPSPSGLPKYLLTWPWDAALSVVENHSFMISFLNCKVYLMRVESCWQLRWNVAFERWICYMTTRYSCFMDMLICSYIEFRCFHG